MIEAYGISDAGCVRSGNEDRVYLDPELGLFAVCDGMGGHRNGKLAADLTVDAIRSYIEASRDRFDVSWPFGYHFEYSVDGNRLISGIQIANRLVWRHAEQSIECMGMGTTVAAVLLSSQNSFVAANVGDSRVYRFRAGSLIQLSHDHTLIAGLLQRGMISPGEALQHPMRNVLTQAIGSKDKVEVHVVEQPWRDGDVLLLCSDGLYGVLDTAAMQTLLSSGERDLESHCHELLAAALAAGGEDNISVTLLRYDAGRNPVCSS